MGLPLSANGAAAMGQSAVQRLEAERNIQLARGGGRMTPRQIEGPEPSPVEPAPLALHPAFRAALNPPVSPRQGGDHTATRRAA